MVHITAIHMSTGGTGHQHIASVKWTNPATSASGQSTTAEMVDFIDNQNGVAKVKNGSTEVLVGTVNATPKYLRTYADGQWTDNLLSLPRY